MVAYVSNYACSVIHRYVGEVDTAAYLPVRQNRPLICNKLKDEFDKMHLLFCRVKGLNRQPKCQTRNVHKDYQRLYQNLWFIM